MSKYVIGNTSSLPEISISGEKDSIFSFLFKRPWNYAFYTFIAVLVLNILLFFVRRYTTFLDGNRLNSFFNRIPWLKKS